MDPYYKERGKSLRALIVTEALSYAKRGHIGAAFSVLDILIVLFDKIMKFDPKNPKDPTRDRLILSKGHGCLGLYALLADKGFITTKDLNLFCQEGGILGGHPDHRKIPGVETSTGALGHGLSVGAGMALAAKIDKANYQTFVILGDGESNEGSNWEAAMSIAKHKLDNLTVLVDYNKLQSYGPTKEILDLEPFVDKWVAFGFNTHEVDLDHPEKLEQLLLKTPTEPGKPTAVICHTIKGKGISYAEGNSAWHHKNKITPEEIESLLKELNKESIP